MKKFLKEYFEEFFCLNDLDDAIAISFIISAIISCTDGGVRYSYTIDVSSWPSQEQIILIGVSVATLCILMTLLFGPLFRVLFRRLKKAIIQRFMS